MPRGLQRTGRPPRSSCGTRRSRYPHVHCLATVIIVLVFLPIFGLNRRRGSAPDAARLCVHRGAARVAGGGDCGHPGALRRVPPGLPRSSAAMTVGSRTYLEARFAHVLSLRADRPALVSGASLLLLLARSLPRRALGRRSFRVLRGEPHDQRHTLPVTSLPNRMRSARGRADPAGAAGGHRHGAAHRPR